MERRRFSNSDHWSAEHYEARRNLWDPGREVGGDGPNYLRQIGITTSGSVEAPSFLCRYLRYSGERPELRQQSRIDSALELPYRIKLTPSPRTG